MPTSWQSDARPPQMPPAATSPTRHPSARASGVVAQPYQASPPSVDSPPAVWAAAYVDLGLALTPLNRGTKEPHGEGWNTRAKVIRDIAVAEQVWAALPP